MDCEKSSDIVLLTKIGGLDKRFHLTGDTTCQLIVSYLSRTIVKNGNDKLSGIELSPGINFLGRIFLLTKTKVFEFRQQPDLTGNTACEFIMRFLLRWTTIIPNE